ncbi:chlorophyll A-B binding protein [Fragilaria crotonensis]|nr:chlorophyll A-B binding protein [Fragilaria crotonensis]
MVKLSAALALALSASAAAFAPQAVPVQKSALFSWDPLSLGELGTGESFDTFPTMFPHKQYLQESEIKQGRMCMLAWTGIWATHEEYSSYPSFIAIAEGESVGHTGDNWKGLSTKEPGNLGFDPWGFKARLSPEKLERYKLVETTNGRAAMIAMASMFAFESIPGSVPLMDLFGAQ